MQGSRISEKRKGARAGGGTQGEERGERRGREVRSEDLRRRRGSQVGGKRAEVDPRERDRRRMDRGASGGIRNGEKEAGNLGGKMKDSGQSQKGIVFKKGTGGKD